MIEFHNMLKYHRFDFNNSKFAGFSQMNSKHCLWYIYFYIRFFIRTDCHTSPLYAHFSNLFSFARRNFTFTSQCLFIACIKSMALIQIVPTMNFKFLYTKFVGRKINCLFSHQSPVGFSLSSIECRIQLHFAHALLWCHCHCISNAHFVRNVYWFHFGMSICWFLGTTFTLLVRFSFAVPVLFSIKMTAIFLSLSQ